MANIDTSESEKGTKFKDLKDIYMIYISKFDMFNKGKTIYHIDRVIRETRETVYNGTHEIYVNTKINDGSEIAEYMQMLKQHTIRITRSFQKSCKAISNIKTGKGDDKMCDLIQEYAEEYAKEYASQEKTKMLVELFNDGLVTVETAVKKLGITEEKFMEYSKEYNKQTI